MVQPCRVCNTSRFYLWQCRTQLHLWAWDADHGPRTGPELRPDGKNAFSIPRGSLQCSAQSQSRHAEPLRESPTIRNHHHGNDTGPRNSVGRQIVFLKEVVRPIQNRIRNGKNLVDVTGIEPATSCLQSTRSPS